MFNNTMDNTNSNTYPYTYPYTNSNTYSNFNVPTFWNIYCLGFSMF
jgi:hypothetical protein